MELLFYRQLFRNNSEACFSVIFLIIVNMLLFPINLIYENSNWLSHTILKERVRHNTPKWDNRTCLRFLHHTSFLPRDFHAAWIFSFSSAVTISFWQQTYNGVYRSVHRSHDLPTVGQLDEPSRSLMGAVTAVHLDSQ